jgi:hypothetical protein
MNFIETQFRKIPVKYRWPVIVVIAFIAAWSFVHIDSYSADKHHLNGFYWITGIVSTVIVAFVFYVAATEENQIEQDDARKRK